MVKTYNEELKAFFEHSSSIERGYVDYLTDKMIFMEKDGHVVTKTNNNGGINGGITNGMPIIFKCTVKPTPSISQEQETVNFIDNKNTTLRISGRHDPAIIRRVCVVVDSVCAIAMCDLIAQRYGTDVFLKGIE